MIMKWISKIVFISLYFLPLVLLFEHINPLLNRSMIPEASTYVLIVGILNIIALRYVQAININTRFLVCVISIILYDYLLIHLLLNKYEQIFWRNGYLYPIVVVTLNIVFFGIYKSYFIPMYGGVNALLTKVWRGKLRTDYVVMSATVNLSISFIFTLWIGNFLNDDSAMSFFNYFAYGVDRIFNFNAWIIQPPLMCSIAIYIFLQMRTFVSRK